MRFSQKYLIFVNYLILSLINYCTATFNNKTTLQETMEVGSQDSFVEYNIALIPIDAGAKKFAAINEKLAEQLLPQGLINRHNKAHISLYHGAYKTQDLSEIAAKLENVSYKTKKLQLHFDDELSVIGNNRYIELKIKPFDPDNETVKQDYDTIVDLHNKVVDIFSKYHQRPLTRLNDMLNNLKSEVKAKDDSTLKMLNYIQTYGMSHIKDLYTPHVTLWYQWPTNSAINNAVKVIEKNIEKAISVDAWAIIFGKLDFNGNIVGEKIGDDPSNHPYAVFPIGERFSLKEAKELALKTTLDW